MTSYVFPRLSWYPEFVMDQIVPVCMGRVFDRTESVDLGFNQKIISPIPEMKTYTASWTETCATRAIELARIAKEYDQRITVTCSGGMDSTSAIAAFLMYTDETIDLTYSDSSIEEWPEFYEMIKNHPRVDRIFHVTFLPFLFMEENSLHRMWVGGDPGDICFGSKMYRHDQIVYTADGSDRHYNVDHWSTDLWKGIPDDHREWYEPIVEKCPVDIENNYDLTWWLGFAIKWQLCTTRLPMMARFRIANFYNFFDSEECQLWAMNNNSHTKCPDENWDNLKHPTKEHLYLFWQDESVWRQVKRDSLRHVWPDVVGDNGGFPQWLQYFCDNPDQFKMMPSNRYERLRENILKFLTHPPKRPPRGQGVAECDIDEEWNFNGDWQPWDTGVFLKLWKDHGLENHY
tara:strand:- start:9422 stop:10627 length:1206 start_codon:yes stop_codon:yes gene_type:complete